LFLAGIYYRTPMVSSGLCVPALEAFIELSNTLFDGGELYYGDN